MNDSENDGPETRSKRRRTSTGALSDISNIGSTVYNFVGNRLSKKRKTSVRILLYVIFEFLSMSDNLYRLDFCRKMTIN